MTFKIFLFLIIYFVIVVVNLIFYWSRTFYVLFALMVITLFACASLLYCGFEFLALSFSMIYIGGIAVMFLFLILVIDVKVDNTRKIVSRVSLILLFSFLMASVVFYFVFFVLNIYDPLQFNNFDFFLLFDSNVKMSTGSLFDFRFIASLYLDFFKITDLSIIGFYWFYSAPSILIILAFYLFIAVIVAIMLCASIYEKIGR